MEKPKPEGSTGQGLTRREFLRNSLGVAGEAVLVSTLPKRGLALAGVSSSIPIAVDAIDNRFEAKTNFPPLTHEQFLGKIQASPEYSDTFNTEFRTVLEKAIGSCVRNNGDWVVPSNNYKEYYFSRDSYWLLSAIKDRKLLDTAARKFHEDQKLNKDGHIASTLREDGKRPENRDRDDESTMMDILRELERKRAGGKPDQASLNLSYKFIQSHIKDGRYVTTGETRSGKDFNGNGDIGSYHYWADTYRPAGKPYASPEVISYNQGLLCVTLRSLKEMGVAVDPKLIDQAEAVYANMANTMDWISLPQRENTSVVDVSALVGEALSLYYFNRPILSDQRVAATLQQFAEVDYSDGKFLGFKVISDYFGDYRPTEEYNGDPNDWEGNYQMGGSWMLYDLLALYVGIRHNLPGLEKMFIQRMQSEIRQVSSSHEFIRTNDSDLGGSDERRDDYGWNTFALNLIP